MFDLKDTKIGIIGLGYVGLPLAVEFSKIYDVVGFDINKKRIKELNKCFDSTMEINMKELDSSSNAIFSYNIEELKSCNVYIVTVPTPINEFKQPDLNPLENATHLISTIINKNDIIIYESTVYPGATEEICIPIIEKNTQFKINVDFFVGYSPERINPGDKKNTLTNIKKIVSGSNNNVTNFIESLYNTIITAGTVKVNTIKVAEAAKIVENIQRDVNIALINELFQIFSRMDININEVVNAASTKWNFMKLYPGLVGGHCISVDPYYLLHKSGQVGYIPDLIRTGREINDGMAEFVSSDFINNLLKNKINPVNLEVALLGFTFKENCPDIRNTKVYDLYISLSRKGLDIKIYDPVASKKEVKDTYDINIENDISQLTQSVCFLAVNHDEIMSNVEFSNFDFVYDFKDFLN